MKKSFLISVAVFCGFLTACSSTENIPDDPNTLPAGIMEPVDGSGASQDSYSWPSDIQTSPMPATMK